MVAEETNGRNAAVPDPHRINRPKEWRSWKLRNPFWIALILLCEIGIIVGIVILIVLSYQHHGFARVQDVSLIGGNSSFAKGVGSQSLLWTSLPVLLMTIFKTLWSMVIEASGQRQPYIELRRTREKAASARKTITLDYSSIPTLWSWAIAFKNRHLHLGCSFLLALALALVPTLAAHLFQTAEVTLNSILPLTSAVAFNESATAAKFDLRFSFDVAAASRIYGGTPPPWTTLEYAFQPFNITGDAIRSTNVTANVTAYSSYLDCVAIPSSQYQLQSTTDSIIVSTTDRGCAIKQQQVISNVTQLYGATFSTQTCSADAGFTRLGMLSFRYDSSAPTRVSNLSLVSCATSYWQNRGELEISLAPNHAPAIVSFTPDNANSTQITPVFGRAFENVLHVNAVFDPTSTAFQDDFARVVYTYATKLNASSPLDSQNMAVAMSTMYTVVYANLISTQVFDRSAEVTFPGILSSAQTRLFVVLPIACVILSIMFLVLICTVVLFVYGHRKSSILSEEPEGLLGHAVLLHRSDVMNLVSKTREEHAEEAEIAGFIDDTYDLEKSECYLEGTSLLNGRIVIGELALREKHSIWRRLKKRFN